MARINRAAIGLFLGCLVVGQIDAGGMSPPASRPMTAEDLWRLRRIGSPSIAPDGAWVAVEVTTYDIDKNDSESEIWLLGTDGKTQRQLTRSGGKNSGPQWSPDGKSVAFTSKRGSDAVPQIYVIDPGGGEARRVSKLPMGAGALKWAVDSKTIYCLAWTWPDAKDDADYAKREKAAKESKVEAFVIDDLRYRYWDKWLADGKRPTVFAVDVESGRHQNLLAGTGMHLQVMQPSGTDFAISPDGQELSFVAETEKPPFTDTNLDVYSISLVDKNAKPRNRTPDNPAVDSNPIYSPDGRYLAYLRQRIKFAPECQQLYVLDRRTEKRRSLMDSLNRSAVNPKWLPDSRRLAFEADDAGVVNMFFVEIDKPAPKSSPSGLSEKSIDFAKSNRLGAYLMSSFDLPPTVFVHGPGMVKPRKISHFNDEIVGSWKLGNVESRKFRGAGDREVQQFILYPPYFDSKRKWPLVQIVHGGPHVGIMSDFSFRWNPQLWAAKGYVIGIVNFHGSSGFGFEFADSITGDFATKPSIDVMRSTDWFISQPWIDGQRLAAAGGSYGGYMMAWLNGQTDRFRAMVCHAGVYSYHNQMASDYLLGRERSLGGYSWTNMQKIDSQSAQRFSANFKTPTLVIHGEKDYRVPVTQGFEYYNTLKLKGVPSRLVYFPDENHWVLKPQNSLLWHREVFGWLEKHLGK